MSQMVLILTRSFLVGLLASSSLGPIFILTFNRGAIHGFSRGFATAVGACIGDGIYFFLGLLGVLAILEESKHFMVLLDTLGGLAVILLGIYSLKKAIKGVNLVDVDSQLGVGLTIVKSFFLTILNPLVFLFFMIIGVQILPDNIFLSFRQIVFGSLMVSLGSLTILTLVALVAAFVGRSINKKHLKIIYLVSGFVFIAVGIYFLNHLISIIR